MNDFLEIAPLGLFPKEFANRSSFKSDHLWEDIHSLLDALEKNAYKEPAFIYYGVGEGVLDFGGTLLAAGRTLEIIRHAYYSGNLLDSYYLLRRLYETLTHYVFSIALRENIGKEESPETDKLARKDFIKGVKLILSEIESEVSGSSDSNPYLEKLDLLVPTIKECKARYLKERLEEFQTVLNLYTNSNALYDKKYATDEARIEFKKNLSFLFSLLLIFITLIKPQLLSSGDYAEAINNGVLPKSGSQYWIAPSIQSYFDFYVSALDPELIDYLKESNSLGLAINLIQL